MSPQMRRIWLSTSADAPVPTLIAALGAVLSGFGPDLPLLLPHAQWIQGLLENNLRAISAAAEAADSTDETATADRWRLADACVRCISPLSRLSEPWVAQQQQSSHQANPGASPADLDVSPADLAAAAAERNDRLLQLLLKWAAADARACAARLSIQRTLASALALVHGLADDLMPSPSSVASLCTLLAAEDIAVR